MNDRKRTAYRAANMGFVFQFCNLPPCFPAVENVEMPYCSTRHSASSRSWRVKWRWTHSTRLDLPTKHFQRPAELSGGQRQRVTIARALVNRPAIVWADEPTGDLDSKTSQDIVNLMLRLNQENNQTFVIVTHSAEMVSSSTASSGCATA